jgi:hypothetical protein
MMERFYVKQRRSSTILSAATTSAIAITGCILLLTLTDAASAPHDPRLWNLPPVAKQRNRNHPFIDQCESLSVALERLRGGDSSNYNDNDDWRTYGPTSTSNYDMDAGDDSSSRRRRQPVDERYSDYDDYGQAPQRSRSNSKGGIGSALPKILKYGDRTIGLPLLGSGVAITFLGISLFFNKSLLRLGNLLFIAGIPMTIGPSRTLGYFVQAEKMRATVCLALGIFLVFVGRPVFGMALEVFGLLNLFGNLFPVVMAFVRHMPLVGPLLKPTKRKKDSRGRDDYYDDHGGRGYDDQRQQPQENSYDADFREDESTSNAQYY